MMFISILIFLASFSVIGAFLTCISILVKSKNEIVKVKNDDLIFQYETELNDKKRAVLWEEIERRGLDKTYLYWRNKKLLN